MEKTVQDGEQPGTSAEGTNNAQESQAETQGKVKRKRNPKFSPMENQVLVEEVTKHQQELFVSSTVTMARKKEIWQDVLNKVNAVGEIRRTVDECKKRWHDIKYKTKKKIGGNLKAAKETGGGGPAPQEELDDLEEQVSRVISEETVVGVTGEEDTADLERPTQHQGECHTWVGGRECMGPVAQMHHSSHCSAHPHVLYDKPRSPSACWHRDTSPFTNCNPHHTQGHIMLSWIACVEPYHSTIRHVCVEVWSPLVNQVAQ